MNNSCSPFRCSRPLVGVALLLFALGGVAPLASAQTSDFNQGSAPGWSPYSLPALWQATFSFPPDDSGGSAYRISAPPTGDDPYGLRNARAGSYRGDVTYTGRFWVRADMIAWNESWHQETGLLFNLSNVGVGTSDGYAATYSSAYHNLYISVLTNEIPDTVGQVNGIVADLSHRYRLEASSHDGYTFLFQMFDKAGPGNPLASAVCLDMSYSSGYCGLFVFEQNYKSATEGAEATFDNYAASAPAPMAMPAVVTDLSPRAGGTATDVHPTVTVGILDRDTAVDTASVLLSLDGVAIPYESLTITPQLHKGDNPSTGLKDFNGATITYPITTLLAWGSRHTNVVAFRDNMNTWQTNTWTWTIAYPFLKAANSLPLGSLTVRGFDVRMAQSANGGVELENSLARARQQLAIPPTIPVDLTTTSIVQTLSWNKKSATENVPGLCAGTTINIAVEANAYLELTAGVHRFHIQSDDRAGLYSGAGLADANPTVLWENPGSTANSTFEFVVEADGLYPVRVIWEETGGDAALYLRSVNLNDLSESLINEPGDPPGAVKAWYPLVCRSAGTPTAPFTLDVTAAHILNQADIIGRDCSPTVVGQMVTGGAFTLPVTDSARFYRLEAPRGTRITKIDKGTSQVVITYTVQ